MWLYLVWCGDKAQIYREKHQFKMLVVLSPIFVADTKIIFGYNFVAPLIYFDLKKWYPDRSNRQGCFVLRLFLKIWERPRGKHRCWSLFLVKLQTPTQVFSWECWEIFKSTYPEEHLPKAASIHTYISNLKIILLIVKIQLFITINALLVTFFSMV